MSGRDKLFIAALLGLLLFAVAGGIFLVHFGPEGKQQKIQEQEKKEEQMIRVVISTTGFEDIFHEKITILAKDDSELIYTYHEAEQSGQPTQSVRPTQSGQLMQSVQPTQSEQQISTAQEKTDGESIKKQALKKGELWQALPETDWTNIKHVRIVPKQADALSVSSITRGYGQPVYTGVLEIRRTMQGYVLINELSLEEYLRHVVPSEMPASFGIEPLKAQAVCARNFAWKHMLSPAFLEFDADLDDSIRYQVYNNSRTNAEADQAVEATAGKLLMYNESVVDAYYYSTSWGYTTDLSLWGGESRPYYTSHWQGDGERATNLMLEEEFRIALEQETDAYESKEAWYRWHVTLPVERILENLRAMPQISMDTLTDIVVAGRRAGGSVSQLVLMGGNQVISLTRESEIRRVFLPVAEPVYRNDGSVLEGYEKLPSSFFAIDKEYQNGKLYAVTIRGGGCGHGIGMSQNCAKALGAQGKTYREILQYFYPGTTVCDNSAR